MQLVQDTTTAHSQLNPLYMQLGISTTQLCSPWNLTSRRQHTSVQMRRMSCWRSAGQKLLPRGCNQPASAAAKQMKQLTGESRLETAAAAKQAVHS